MKKTNAQVATTTTSFWAKFKSFFQTFWNDLNDPAQIRRRNTRSTEGRILDNTALIIAFALIAAICFAIAVVHANQNDVIKDYSIIAFFTSFGIVCWLTQYRKAIANGEQARTAFIARTKLVYHNCFRTVVRAIRSLIWLAIATVAISFALQYVPGMGELSPELMQLSQNVITFFNDILSKVLAYFA